MGLELEGAGLNIEQFIRVETAEEFQKTLLLVNWDIVICDYYLPTFNALQALEIINASQPELPLILFSGQANSETAQKVLQAGAAAVVNKDHRQFLKKTIEQVVIGNISSDNNKIRKMSSLFDEIDIRSDLVALGSWEWDIQQDNLIWDKQMYTIYGVERGQFQHDFFNWLQLIHPDDRSLLERTLQYCLLNKKIFLVEFRIVRPDGETQYIKANGIAQWDSSGLPLRMVGTNENITKVREIQKELREAKKVKSEFLSCMSHELRTPLNAILGFSQLLQADNLTEDQYENVKEILSGGYHLLKLIDQLLNLEKIEEDMSHFNL